VSTSKDRAVAHAALLSLSRSLAADGTFQNLSPSQRDLIRTAFTHTTPRPLSHGLIRCAAFAVAFLLGFFSSLGMHSTAAEPGPYPNPTLTPPAWEATP
jgi:hypothetical protein